MARQSQIKKLLLTAIVGLLMVASGPGTASADHTCVTGDQVCVGGTWWGCSSGQITACHVEGEEDCWELSCSGGGEFVQCGMCEGEN